jgi:ubiquinone/menaquinone biosynthesis C-methylase UbiE
MTAQLEAGLVEVKKHARASWAMGDFAEVARRQLWEVGERVVRRVGVGRGEDVLDVACGTGNAALRAAQAGGHVTGVDLTPELFETGRRLAAEAGVEIQWDEGDAEALPYADESFDVVLSTFGVIFAPRHRVAAAELARVVRRGGRFCFTAWTPEGLQGAFFRTMGEFAPPPPPFVEPMLDWGTERHVSEIFEGTGVTLEFDRESVPLADFGTADEDIEWSSRNFGPAMMLRAYLEQQGRWEEAADAIKALYSPHAPLEYLVVTGRKE